MPVAMPPSDDAVLARRAEIVAALKRLVPGEGVIASEEAMRPYESDGLTAYRQLPMVVVLPSTTAQVVRRARAIATAKASRWCRAGPGRRCRAARCRSATASCSAWRKFNRIRDIDFANRVAVVEPGVTNLAVTQAVEACRLLLRARSVLADRLHHRRQCRGEFRRRALPQIRRHHQQRARLRDGADHRRDRAARRQASRCRRLRSARHRHRLRGAARRRHRGHRAHPAKARDRARGADRLRRRPRTAAPASPASSAPASFPAAWR